MEPYLSVVVATRNDDHGGDPLKRLQAFINTFAAQCRRTSLDAELIVVEWNPPSGKPRVSELCRVPPDTPFAVRFVEVPAQLHQERRFSGVLPLFQMIAKNVGLRRARGRFVLATNIDIVFSNELVEHLASDSLAPDHLYRVDRHDIESDFPIDADLTEQMAFCQTHQIRVHARSGTHPVDPLGRLRTLEPDVVAMEGVTLGDGWHTREGDSTQGFYRWARQEARFTVDRTAKPNLVRGAVLDVEIGPNPYQPDSWVELEIVDGARRLARRRVSRRAHLQVPLDDGVARHEIVMRMLDSSGGRQWLPLFESREQLSYRVWQIRVGTTSSDVPLENLNEMQPPSTFARFVRRLGKTAGMLNAPFRWARSTASSIDRQREVDARVAALAPLAELAPFAQLLREHRPVGLHQNACGDFQLMAREHWFALRGYPELEMFSMSLDGLLETLAHSAGIREQVFEMPLCVYHLEHERGSGWTPEGEVQLRQRIAESGITWLDASTVHIWATYMQWLRRPMILNDAGWGLGDVALPEKTVQRVADTV